MPASQRRTSVGNIYSFLSFLDDFGLQVGGSPTAPAAGVSSGALRLKGIMNAPRAIPQPDVVQVMGDDDVLAEFNFDPSATRSYIATLSVSDEILESRLLGVTVRTFGEMRYYEEDFPNAPDYTCVVWHQARTKSQDTGSPGAQGYEGSILHAATVRALGRTQFNMREPAEYRLLITPLLATKDWRGITINNSESGVDSSRSVKFATVNPIHMQPFTGAGSAAAVQLDYTPISVARTRFVIETGIGTGAQYELGNAASISAANKTATPPSSITSGLHGFVCYEFAL